MKILILGSGGREHAFAWKLSQSPQCGKLFVAPGNAGTAAIATNIKIGVNDFEAIEQFCKDNAIDLVLPGPEDPLVNGIVDYFHNKSQLKNVLIVGPEKAAAMLEGSKDFAKVFMTKYGIPTAAYKSFNAAQILDAFEFLKTLKPPYVLKADGLAAGKGVVICDKIEDAKLTLRQMLVEKLFGDSSATVVIEEFLSGIEVSMFVLTDGESYVMLPEAKDYKRIGVGDTGLNTGGMGAISPVPFADEVFKNKVIERIVKPTITGLQKEQLHYRGFVFIGLMNVDGEPYVIEYNVRMGDPETEAVLPRLNIDFADLLKACASGKLKDYKVKISDLHSATVVMVSGGYPGAFEKGFEISGAASSDKAIVFHSGTAISENGKSVSAGGRVLAITGIGKNKDEAMKNAFKKVEGISFNGSYFRSDIGQDL